MHKKIIGIFVCMLLIISVYAVSATNIKMQETNVIEEVSNKGEPDFVIRKIIVEYAYGGDIGDRVAINVGIDNIGSPVEKMNVRLRLGFEGYPDFTTDHTMSYEGTELQYTENPWPGLKRPCNKCVYTLVVEIDPDNEIPELDDENNVKTKIVTFLPRFKYSSLQNNQQIISQSGSSQQSSNPLFLKFLERFPVLSRLLYLIN